jgi:aspartate dehydrogenase
LNFTLKVMKRSKIKVGIIGCGTIGSEIARACLGRLKDKVILSALCDADRKKCETLKNSLRNKAPILSIDGVVKVSNFVVEAASASISAGVLKKCIAARKDCLVMSTGGLLAEPSLLAQAEKRKVRVFVPSGAVCGIDGLKSANVGGIAKVTLTTRKPPRGLAGAPYIVSHKIDLGSMTEDAVVFEGSADEAVKAFPQNVNVAAVLSLAGIGARKTLVRIIATPGSAANIHEVEIAGESGRITTRSENVPSKANPRTSALAVYSAIATLEGAVSPVRIGT